MNPLTLDRGVEAQRAKRNPFEERGRDAKVGKLVAYIDNGSAKRGWDPHRSADNIARILRSMDAASWATMAGKAGSNEPSDLTRAAVVAVYEKRALVEAARVRAEQAAATRYVVRYHSKSKGGVWRKEFTDRAAAEAFAVGLTLYAKPAVVFEEQV